jgi:tRNA (uracil-5-)-methyltransferase TRM9
MSQLVDSSLIPISITNIDEFENIYVKRVYNIIADDFNRTRYSYWDYVHKFILSLKSFESMLDLGCGNGKYLSVREDLDLYALDNCENLIQIVKHKYPLVKTFISDVSTTPFDSASFDSIISIAVIHHLATQERRLDMIREIIRILKPDGQALITAWATEQTNTNTLTKANKISDSNDWLIPWEDKKKKIISQRFYHLFGKDEFEKLLSNFPNIKIIDSKYDKDNWNVIFVKIF